MIEKIDHIGIAVKNLEEAVKIWEKLGFKVSEYETVEDQKVRAAIIWVGNSRIELLEPTSEDSPIAKFIEKKGEGIHHIAFAVDNIDEKLEQLANNGVNLIDKKSRSGAENLKIGFVHPKSTFGVLMELCE